MDYFSRHHQVKMTRPKHVVANFNFGLLTPPDIEQGTDELLNTLKADYKKIEELKRDDVTFENTIQALLILEVKQKNKEVLFNIPVHVMTDRHVREASLAAGKRIGSFVIEITCNKKIFDNVCHFKSKFGLDNLSQEHQRYVEKFIVDGKRMGLHLDEDKMQEVRRLKTRISQLGLTFAANFSEDNTIVTFNKDELAGVPQDLVDSFEQENGKYKVTLKLPHYLPIVRKCQVPETRKKLVTAYQSRCLESNSDILIELVQLRHQLATILGYQNHAAYTQEVLMSQNPETVSSFLNGLVSKILPLWEKEKEKLINIKKRECEKHGYQFNNRIDSWDLQYLMTLVEENEYSVDKEKLREYFPLDKVRKGLFKIYQKILGVVITKVENPEKWHPEVEMFRVRDSDSKKTLGYFFLDLFSREGKFAHAAVSPLQPGCIGPDGKRQVSVVAMAANFANSTVGKPALLHHHEVVTFFHEFGHVMHCICARAETARFSCYNVQRDFIEAPSQMLENWCWEEETLEMISGHYKTGEPIPKDLLEKLVASRTANIVYSVLSGIIFSTFDQTIHTQAQADPQKVYAEIFEKLLGVSVIEGTNRPASFLHLAGQIGYDGMYYSYLWCQVFSSDMFETRFKMEGIMNRKLGAEYRKKILEPGGSKDASELLRDFLCRDPKNEAFLAMIGIK